MDPMLPKAKQWIDENKDPRSARWQAGLEAVMDIFLPGLVKGQLTPVCPMDERDRPVFESALEQVDLSPNLWAAFLPPRVADTILPPDTMEELSRIKKGNPSYKIIIQRPGKESRLLCAEISKHAHRPGIDIFQSGAFLGNFDYDTHEVCIAELPKAIRAHGWEKTPWQPKDYQAYTLNWFEKTTYLGKAGVIVDENRSFFHSSTLIKTDRVDALFQLLYKTIQNQLAANPENFHPSKSEDRGSACSAMAENCLLDLLNLVKNLELMDFANFTNAENHKFQNEFVRTVRKLSSDLDILNPA